MKKIFFFFILTILTAGASAQSKLNFSLFKKVTDAKRQNTSVCVLVKGDIEKIKSETAILGGTFRYSAGDIASIRIPVSSISKLASENFVLRIEDGGGKLENFNDTMIINNNVWPVHVGMFPLTQAYTGAGVIVGIIDEGIDLVHQDFKDILGNTRIKYVWDQVINNDPGGITPTFGYGTEWNSTAINNGAASAHHDGPLGHGTFVAGVAAGNGFAVGNYKGVAPGSDIIAVSMDLNVPDDTFLTKLNDAVQYIFEKAQAMGEPAVVNISLGTYFGSHDAKDLPAQMMEAMIASHPGRAVVCAAGNAGDARIHLGYNVPSDTAFTWLKTRILPAPYPSQAYIGIYGDTADMNSMMFAVAADDTSDYSLRGATSFSSVNSLMGLNPFTIMNGGNQIATGESYGSINGSSFSLEIVIYPDTLNYFWRIMSNGSGHFDAWSFDYIFDNLPSPSDMPLITKYRMPDLTQNIASSFTCSDKVITVGSYQNRGYYIDVHGVPRFDDLSFPPPHYLLPTNPGEISVFSSHGPTRDNRFKPDITSTGDKVVSTGYLPRIISLLNSNYDYFVAAGGKHTVGSGTSFASPAVAGIAALYLQKNPNATWAEIKSAILSCAKHDAFTGNSLPDNTWGYGKADAFRALTDCFVGMDEQSQLDGSLNMFPNPADAEVTIHYSLLSSASSQQLRLVITDVIGKTVSEFSLSDNRGAVKIQTGNYSSGVYACSLFSGKKLIDTKKLVVK